MLWSLFRGVLSTSLALSLVLCPLLLALPLLRRRYRPGTIRLLWILLALRLILPFPPVKAPQLAIPVGVDPVNWEQMAHPAVTAFLPTVSPASHLQAAVHSSGGGSLSTGLAVLWLGGVALLLFFQGTRHLRTRRRLLCWSTPGEETLDGLLERCRRETGVQRSIAVRQCGVLDTPLLTGLLSPVILLPDLPLTQPQLRCVLLHELTHWRRGDLWVKLLLLSACALHWFNPLVWWMATQAQADLEIACDARVLQGSGLTRRREYANTILLFLQHHRQDSSPLAASLLESRTPIVRRFTEMMQTKNKSKGPLLTALILAATLHSATLVGCVEAKAAQPVREIPSTPLTREESKSLYDADPQAYQQRQQAFQQAVSTRYGSQGQADQPSLMGWPVPGHCTVSAPYGWRYDGTDFHLGLDISDPEIQNAPVVAAAAGTVAWVSASQEESPAYGLAVILDHGDGLSTLYAHLEDIQVEAEEAVEAGQTIGLVGATGHAAQPQLHFEVREQGMDADVSQYLLPAGWEKAR